VIPNATNTSATPVPGCRVFGDGAAVVVIDVSSLPRVHPPPSTLEADPQRGIAPIA
jgi:hypothetical protein